MADGLLLIRKDAGPTSNGVLGRLKARLGTRDLGHGGTLDSFATGLLPVFLGEGLKLSRFFLESHPTLPTYWKSYRATMKLGVATAALDPTTEVTERAPVPILTTEGLETLLQNFRGTAYEQMPPTYSAKKIAGKRASDLVREGEKVELSPQRVEIRGLEGRIANADEIEFSVTCSKGTYVRALARDLAARLGTVAHLTKLERTAVGNFRVEDADCVDEAEVRLGAQGFLDLSSLCSATLPSHIVCADDAAHLIAGRGAMVLNKLKDLAPSPYYAKMANGTPIALIEVSESTARLLRCFRLAG